jgi:hypothetical protein
MGGSSLGLRHSASRRRCAASMDPSPLPRSSLRSDVVRAYKFLDRHNRAVFSGFRWPVPDSADSLGAWVETGPVEPCRQGIHGCRPADLGFWLNEELWEIELDGDVVEAETKVIARRGRLRRPIAEWAGDVARELVEVTAFRTRDIAVAFCRNGSGTHPASPDAAGAVADLAGCTAGEELGRRAVAAYKALPSDSQERTAVGFVIDAAHFLDAHVCHTPYVAACAAGHAASARTGSRAEWEIAVTAERRWQSAWITDRLNLS